MYPLTRKSNAGYLLVQLCLAYEQGATVQQKKSLSVYKVDFV